MKIPQKPAGISHDQGRAMLILTRKLGERITIGEEITIILLETKGNQVKLGIEAPRHVSVHRQEIYERIKSENLESSDVKGPDLSKAISLLTTQSKGVDTIAD